MSRSVLYYPRNDQTPLDISDDMVSVKITKEYNHIDVMDLVLSNNDGKYSESDGSGTHLAYNHDILVSIGGVQRFLGMIVEKQANLVDSTVSIKCMGYGEILRRKTLRCWGRIFLNKSIYDIITSGINRLTYKIQDTGDMSPTGTKQEIVNTGVANDANTQIVLETAKMPTTGTAMDGLKILADLLNYHFYVVKTINPSTKESIHTLYFIAKYQSAIIINATLGTNLMQNNIVQSEVELVDRVVIYGSKEAGVIAEAGATFEDSSLEFVESNEGYKDYGAALQRANTVYGTLNQIWYEGDVLLTSSDYAFNPQIDNILRVNDAQNAMTNKDFRIAKVEINLDGSGFDVRCYVDKTPYTGAKPLDDIKRDVMAIDAFRTDVVQTYDCIVGKVETISPDTLHEWFYGFQSDPVLVGTATGVPGQHIFSWNAAVQQTSFPFLGDTFKSYKIYKSFATDPNYIVKDTDTLAFSTINRLTTSTTLSDLPSGFIHYKLFIYWYDAIRAKWERAETQTIHYFY